MEIIERTVKYKSGRKYKRKVIIAICDYCGKKFEYRGGIAHYNRTKHHYCSRSCQGYGNNAIQGNYISGIANRQKTEKEDYKRYQLWLQAKTRAKKKRIEFNLNPSDVPEIPDECPLLGILIDKQSKKLKDNSPTIDRIDNSKGYVKDNIIIVSFKANRIKSNAALNELKTLVKNLEVILNEGI